MTIVRYTSQLCPAGAVGVLREGFVHRCAGSLGELLALAAPAFRATFDGAASQPAELLADVRVTAPVDAGTEVWAAGVTYERSRAARVEESVTDVYTMVYDAQRPEVFFKAIGWRVVTDGEPIAVRRDSALNVPEPELALVVNAHREIVGYAAANDVSSRSIEGDNPLYLPQAKVYAGSCALSAGITPAWLVDDPTNLPIAGRIDRGGQTIWSAETSTRQLHRTFSELVDALFAETDFPYGVFLLTGTGIVPDLATTLLPHDTVTIEIPGVGRLSNPVVLGKSGLVPALSR